MTKPSIDTCAEIFLNGEALIETIPDTYVAPSSTQGQGLYSRRAWAKNEVLCVLDGQVVEANRYPVLLTEMEWNALPDEMLLVRPLRTSYGFINHSADPNTDPRCSDDCGGRGNNARLCCAARTGRLSGA